PGRAGRPASDQPVPDARSRLLPSPDRLGRTHGGGTTGRRAPLPAVRTQLRRHRLRLGHGGHHRVREAAGRPGDPPPAGRPPDRPAGAHAGPAAHPGHGPRPHRRPDGPRPALYPSGNARSARAGLARAL
ncbi:uncharacterized protein METZ01_LOCUS78399, partial [marine metagenome]